MPPLPYPRMSTAEIQAFTNWVSAGTPAGTCSAVPDGGTTTPPPAQTGCSSNSYWNFGTLGRDYMNPGLACRSCHLGNNFQNQNPGRVAQPNRAYYFMGTVFPSLHEKDTCNANPGNVVVEILDASGAVKVRMGVNSPSGNFFSGSTSAGFAMPYTARVVANGKTVAMGSKQTDGDCNTCHTEQGLNGAPGRITVPQ
jgi:hypothetical protein